MALQFRRGTAADLPATGAAGEPLFVVDEGKLYVGTGSGRVLIAGGGSGEDGREIELQTSATHVQWRYVGDSAWTNLIALTAITGPAGADGADGADGAQGPAGPQGPQGPQGPAGEDASLPAATAGQTGYLAWDGSQWVFQADEGGGPSPDTDFDLAFLSTQNLDPADSPPAFDEAAVSIEAGPTEIADTSALRTYLWSNNEGDSTQRYAYYAHRNSDGSTAYSPQFAYLDSNGNAAFSFSGISIGNLTIGGNVYRVWQLAGGNPLAAGEGISMGVE